MLNNYEYFLVLAEEQNISNAAKRLFISHQCLSKYIKNLESTYGVTLFDRKPNFKLTSAGEAVLQVFREIELAEKNLDSKLIDIKNAKVGTIKLGITEGRYPIIIPKLLKMFNDVYPNVTLKITSSPTPIMVQKVLNNDLDLFLSNAENIPTSLSYMRIMDESLYLIISDNLLKKYFSDYPKCKNNFKKGADLHKFKDVPFVLNKKRFSSRIMLDRYLVKIGETLNCIAELTQPDMQYRLSAEDYAATCCFSMYLPSIKQLNQLNKHKQEKNMLNIYPIAGLQEVNVLGLIYKRNKIFPKYTLELCKMIKQLCISSTNN